MEIQGLSNAPNTHYQHGVATQLELSQPETTNGTVSGLYSPGNDHNLGLRSDRNNNKRASPSPFRLPPQNGSAAGLQEKRNERHSGPPQQVPTSGVGFCNLNALKEREYGDLELPPDFVKLKYGDDENEDGVLQMALPLFDGEEDGYTERREQTPSPVQLSTTSTSNNMGDSFEDKARKEIYVVFNIVKEDEEGSVEQRGDTEAVESARRLSGGQNSLGFHEQKTNKPNVGDRSTSFKRTCDRLCDVKSERRKTEPRVEAMERDKLSSVLDVESIQQPISGEFGDGPCKNVESGDIHAQELPVTNNSSEIEENLVNLASGTNGDSVLEGPPETFSGTIMINNQSIIVTIENGVLTLAAPPDNYTYKEDGVNIREHLGVKDEDIVLLNYEGGGKTVGKMVEDEQETISDSEELTLADDCPLSDLGSSLDPSVKHEDETLRDREPAKDQTEDEQLPLGAAPPAGLTKKASAVSYQCPQPDCAGTFETRQKLKMHLVFHAEDQRPFKCTVEGCGWSFTTSYKLKRHLQSHYKLRPYVCKWENCGRCFTTVYNLKAHARAHEQEDSFPCEMCGERFRSTTRLANHQKTHFEPERPHKCEFPGCEKAFITFSALFSHNRTHFRETVQFTCTYPGCEKRYDKACRLKIHLRSHTGERPFVCDFESCESTFTSMSKLLRHKRKHDDDRRFTCPEKGCGKSFTRAEHLKGHSITHLGTKPFECPVEGCSAKFSARSSLYIHSKKHRQDGVCLRSRCPVAGCIKHFSSRSSLKSHMLKHHNLSPDVLNQLENTATLTPSCELTSAAQTATAPGSVGAELSSLDLSSLFSSVPSGATTTPVGPVSQSGPASFSMDMALVGSGILTIDPASVGSALVGAKTMDPLILAAGGDLGAHVLDPGTGGGVLQTASLHLDDVQTVNPEALGALTTLAIQNISVTDHIQALSSSNALTAVSPSSSLTSSLTPSLSSAIAPSLSSSLVPSFASTAVQELLSPQVKTDLGGSETPVGPLLSGVEGLSQSENNKSTSQFVFPSHSTSFSGRKESELLPSVTSCSFLESSGSARTDYRAIQLAKRKKQKSPAASSSTSGAAQRKSKGLKGCGAAAVLTPANTQFSEGVPSTTAGLTIRDPVTGAQYVQIQLLQDDPATDGDLAFQLSSQTSSSHSQLTVDLPVNILQEPSAMTEDDNGSNNSQFTGSTINLQDLE